MNRKRSFLCHQGTQTMRNDVITLTTQYKDGRDIKEKDVEVFAERKSLTRNEFYSAINVNLSPKWVFEMSPDEYSLADVDLDGVIYHATHVKYEGHKLNIIRTYEKSYTSMELTVG